MSYFTRLVEQSGLMVAPRGASRTGAPIVAPAEPADGTPADLQEVHEVVEVTAPHRPAFVPRDGPRAMEPLPPGRQQARVAEPSSAAPPPADPPPSPLLAEPSAPAGVAARPAASAAPRQDRAPAAPPPAARLVQEVLRWVAAGPTSAPQAAPPSPPLGAPPTPVVSARPAAAREEAAPPPILPEHHEPQAVPLTPQLRESRSEPRPTAAPPRTAVAPPNAPRPAHASPTPTRSEAEIEEVVQVSIGNIHVRVETPAARPVAATVRAPPAAAPTSASQPPATRLRRRYLHP